jgi:hypothetical protein
MARLLDWPALVVEGGDGLADELILAAAPYGVTAINRHAGPEALFKIKTSHGSRLLAEVEPHDPRGIVETSIRPLGNRYSEAAESRPQPANDDAPFEMPEPSAAVDEDARQNNADHAADFFSNQRRRLDELRPARASSSAPNRSAPPAPMPVPEGGKPGTKP